MVPPSSVRIPRARTYSGYRPLTSDFTYEVLTLSDRPSHAVRLSFVMLVSVRTPQVLLPTVWPLPRSLAATYGISVDFFSSGYLDVSVPRVPFHGLWIHPWIRDSSSRGFPHSEIRGSMLICSSPRLIAACHVLHRLLMPRHSPCALVCLNFPFAFLRLSFVQN